mgnify:CR=1 FL=1
MVLPAPNETGTNTVEMAREIIGQASYRPFEARRRVVIIDQRNARNGSFIEVIGQYNARTRPDTLCVGLHPGTVDTALSAPFQRGVAEGQLLAPAASAAALLAVLDGLTPADSGGCFDWQGKRIAP